MVGGGDRGARSPVNLTPMALLDILACPRCKSSVTRHERGLACTSCDACYPVVDGTPVMFPTDDHADVVHEDELEVRDGFNAEIQQFIDTLPPDHIILDIGAGCRDTPDPRVVRMDVMRTPYVDVVGDAHALPFRDDAVHIVHAAAVFEHLRKPWVVADEIVRVLRPGGNVFVDSAFVFPFHGYPATYFNISTDGMRQLFSNLTETAVGVMPWMMPSFAVEQLLSAYLKFFKPETDDEHEFVNEIYRLDRFDLRSFDRRFSQQDAARIAACIYYCGYKPDPGHDSLPAPIVSRWKADPALQARYPDPLSLLETVEGRAHNVFVWARGEGRQNHADVADWLDGVEPYSREFSG